MLPRTHNVAGYIIHPGAAHRMRVALDHGHVRTHGCRQIRLINNQQVRF
jgi:hypothetical protein